MLKACALIKFPNTFLIFISPIKTSSNPDDDDLLPAQEEKAKLKMNAISQTPWFVICARRLERSSGRFGNIEIIKMSGDISIYKIGNIDKRGINIKLIAI